MQLPSFERQRREIVRVQEKHLRESLDGRRILALREQGSRACDDHREVSDGRQ